MTNKYTGNFCTSCKKELPSENFAKKWSKFQNKYILIHRCKKCRSKKQKKYRESNLGKSAFKNYLSQGFFGWTTEWENKLLRYVFRYVKDDNEWEKKLMRSVTINSYDYFRDGLKPGRTLLSDDARRAKLIESAKANMLKKKHKMNYHNIIGEALMMRCQTELTNREYNETMNIWEKRCVKLIKGYVRAS